MHGYGLNDSGVAHKHFHDDPESPRVNKFLYC